MDKKELEQTLVLIKPDALKNSLTGFVLSQLSEYHTGLRFAGTKIVQVNKMLAEEHYSEHKGKVFFPSLIEYITGAIHFPDDASKRRVKAFIFQGPDAVKVIRKISGPTNPHDAREKNPGCIRSMGTVVHLKDSTGKIIGDRMDNLIHASATDAEAEREIKLWFKPLDVPPLIRAYETEISQTHFYYKEGKLYNHYEKDSTCLIAPGDVVWKSDLEALLARKDGFDTETSIETIAAKYLINVI